ncbi:MAG: class I SAM-dependent RNA methyltransferase [Acidimicrobiales bacterium]
MSTVGTEIELSTDAVAVGGDAVGRDTDGRVVFVSGALAGERARVRLRTVKKRFAHADLVEVLDPAPGRIEPRCPHVDRGCGGCGWAHLDPSAQRLAKVDMVAESLARLGGLDQPSVRPGPVLAGTAFRTTIRAAVIDERGGYRMASSDQRLAVDSCRVAHPLVEEMLIDGRFDGADEAVLRAGARTGERLARVSPTANDVTVPDDVLVVGADELAAGRRAWIHEEVSGIRFRISADSFFQIRPDGAEALVDAVAAAVEGAPPGAPMVDLYCGVGLFAATVGADRPVVAVEASRAAVADARHNLNGQEAKVIRAGVERWRPSPAEIVVADPPRTGLGRDGAAKVDATGAHHLALVSCDAAALGRDAALLVGQGWTLEWAQLVDLFVDTPHVEVVACFTR